VLETALSRLALKIYFVRHKDRWHLAPGQIGPELAFGAAALPRIVFDRGAETVARRTSAKYKAWITTDAIALLEDLLKPTDRVFEFGAGNSTVWLASMVGQVTSVEEAADWAEMVRQRAKDNGYDNVDVRLVPVAGKRDTVEHREAYINAAPEIEAGSLGMVLVDGQYRDECALRGLGLLRSGGLLVLDNAETYLPSDSRSPWVIKAPATLKWAQFLEEVAEWRNIWTTNGVWDTAIWIKP
jgi:predicted O-methyltransferase YrrM